MDESRIKVYKIGDVAKILGISADSMRYYEKMGIVKPYKVKSNDYRYYEAWDINFIIDCLWFKQFGFGMKEIAQMVSSISYDELEDTLRIASRQLREELSFQKMLLSRLEEQVNHLEVSKTLLNQCDIQDSPPRLSIRRYPRDSAAVKTVAALSVLWKAFFLHHRD